MRTLVISDLHLGARPGIWVLERPDARAALGARLPEVDRLVLLGDLVELRQGPLERVLAAALPVVARLGEALGSSKEVVFVPGNHDHRLLGAWRERRSAAAPLELESSVDWRPEEPLGALADALAPAHVRVCYPGVWLREDVYATHGHYLDRHITVPILERLGAGATGLLVGEPPPPGSGETAIGYYESVLAPLYGLIDIAASRGLTTGLGLQTRVWRTLESTRGQGGWRQRGGSALLPWAVGLLNRAGLGPLNPDLSGPELRRAGLRAFDEVLRRLAVPAQHVIFGHTHRAGPLPDDDRAEWISSAGANMINSGSWVHSPELTGRRPQTSPYRAGFAVVVEEEGPPAVVNLLDDLRSQASPGVKQTA